MIRCPGVVVTDTDGKAICQDALAAPLAWETSPAFDISTLDPLMMPGAFSAGFVIVATGMVVGMGFRLVLSLLK